LAHSEESLKLVRGLGRWGIEVLRYVGGMGTMFAHTLYWTFVAPVTGRGRFRWRAMFKQMVRVGFESIPIVATVLLFVGMVVALQMAYVLKMFNVVRYAATAVSISMIRELGPLLVAIVMSGFAGASIAAELGTMRVSEEITALEVSALNPIRFLVVPRALAVVVMVPCVVLVGDLVGIFGGYIVGVGMLGIEHGQYVDLTLDFLRNKDFFTGGVKSVVFGLIISLVACHEGFRVRGGAEGVGKATTSSVVMSIIFIIIADVLITSLFYYILD